MKSSIKAKFTEANVKVITDRFKALLDTRLLTIVQRAGEQFVADARSTDTYKDQTGNLRSSIGYVILKDGKRITEAYDDTVKPVLKQDGTLAKDQPINSAKTIIDFIAEKYPTGYVLVGIAGMQYAAAVESRGFDVITSSAIKAEDDLIKSFNDLKNEFGKK